MKTYIITLLTTVLLSELSGQLLDTASPIDFDRNPALSKTGSGYLLKGSSLKLNVSTHIEGDHILELNDPKNTIVEYASLTCPHCATFHSEVFPKIKSELVDTGKVKYIFRDFPIDPIAMAGSMIAHCSGDDKYFGVINVLLKTQDQWLFDNKNPYNGLLKVARLAGLSEEDVKLCLNNTELFNQIESNQRIATSRFGVNGTPSVFVNNKKISTLDFDTILAELNLSYE